MTSTPMSMRATFHGDEKLLVRRRRKGDGGGWVDRALRWGSFLGRRFILAYSLVPWGLGNDGMARVAFELR